MNCVSFKNFSNCLVDGHRDKRLEKNEILTNSKLNLSLKGNQTNFAFCRFIISRSKYGKKQENSCRRQRNNYCSLQ